MTGPASSQTRDFSIQRSLLLALIAIAAMPNGLFFSPFFDPVLYIVPRTASAFFLKGQEVTFYLAGAVLWLFTLLLAAIPAAIYERIRGQAQSSTASLLIWLVVALVLSIPSFLAVTELFSEP